MNSLETNKLEEASRLIEAAEKAEALRAETTKNLSAVLKRLHSKHIFTIESMIGRYQHDLEKAAVASKKPVARIAQLKALAQLYVPQAVAAGYQRGLSDLKTNGWVSKYIPVTPANAPQGVIQSILTDNEKYLTTSLLPDLQAGMSDKARIARMKLYGHFLWKAAERAYVQAILDCQTALKARNNQDRVKESMVEVGNENSGNHDHAGRPGQVGGSAPSGSNVNVKTVKNLFTSDDVIHGWFMSNWVESSKNPQSHFLQMLMNEAAGKDRFDNLVTPYRDREGLQNEYDAELRKAEAMGGSEEQLKQWCATQAENEAKAYEKVANGGMLLRGVGAVEAAALSKANIGDHVQFRPLLSTTDDISIAQTFSKSFISFQDVRPGDVFDSYRTEPLNGIMHLQNENETVLRGNTHDWVLDSKVDLGEQYNPYTESGKFHAWAFVFKAAPMAEAERDSKVMVLHSNMDFGSKKIVDDCVTYKTVKPRIKVREGGVGSGNYGHDGRPGQRGGSAAGGSSIVPNIIARSIVRDGGITISTTGVRPRSGFAIAGIRNAAGDKVETIIHGEAKPEDVQKFVNENKDILRQPNHYIGGWVNDGKTYLDVSEVQNDKATALDKAESRDEIAIYDLGTGEEHFTREDHLRPSESKADRAA